LKLKNMYVGQGENSDFDTYKDVEKYEKKTPKKNNSMVVKSF